MRFFIMQLSECFIYVVPHVYYGEIIGVKSISLC